MKKTFLALLEGSGEIFPCDGEQSLLRSMEALGRRGIPVGCRGGGCGVCKVQVITGAYRTGKMSRACLTLPEEEAGIVLACKLFPDSDLQLRVLDKMARLLLRSSKKS